MEAVSLSTSLLKFAVFPCCQTQAPESSLWCLCGSGGTRTHIGETCLLFISFRILRLLSGHPFAVNSAFTSHASHILYDPHFLKLVALLLVPPQLFNNI